MLLNTLGQKFFPRLIGATDKFIFEVDPSRDASSELVANVWLQLGDILQLIGVNGEIGKKFTPACRFEGVFHFPSRTPNRYLPNARQKVDALRPVGSE